MATTDTTQQPAATLPIGTMIWGVVIVFASSLNWAGKASSSGSGGLLQVRWTTITNLMTGWDSHLSVAAGLTLPNEFVPFAALVAVAFAVLWRMNVGRTPRWPALLWAVYAFGHMLLFAIQVMLSDAASLFLGGYIALLATGALWLSLTEFSVTDVLSGDGPGASRKSTGTSAALRKWRRRRKKKNAAAAAAAAIEAPESDT